MSHAIEFVPIPGTIEAVFNGFQLAQSRGGEEHAAHERRLLSDIGPMLCRWNSIISTSDQSMLQS